MRLCAHSPGGIFVTGAGGFIGSGVCRALRTESTLNEFPVDVRDREQLREVCGQLKPRVVIHLASKGTVTSALEQVPTLLDTAIHGVLNVTTVLNPERFVLASSCAVYGNTGPEPAPPDWKKVNPLSVYGITKALTEKLVTLWAREYRRTAVILRLGNVVGKGCGGLISYLVRHAIRHQDPLVPAQMRGEGKIVRDYVPLDHVAELLVAAADTPVPSGTVRTFNVGTGEGMTNRRVAEIVQSVLRAHGYRLEIEWDPEPAYGEGLVALLDVAETQRIFALPRPRTEEVFKAIEEGTIDCLERLSPARVETHLRSAVS